LNLLGLFSFFNHMEEQPEPWRAMPSNAHAAAAAAGDAATGAARPVRAASA